MQALTIRQLYKTYANGFEAVKGIDLDVPQGDFFALLGVNGAGKSTTIGLITSLLQKTAGHINICGYDLDATPEKAKACLGLVPQEVNLNIFETCEQIMLNQAGYYGISRQMARIRCEQLLKQLGLLDKRFNIVRHLSGGMKRRLMIARALVHNPRVLILDEPTAGVDIEIRRDMWNFLKATNAAGTTLILTTHYLEEAEQLCKNVAIIDGGLIKQQSSMKALLQTMHYQTFVFDTRAPLEVLPCDPPFAITPIDAHSFEVRLNQSDSLNDVFAYLSQHHIDVYSMRNKTNRLEALFMDLIHHDD